MTNEKINLFQIITSHYDIIILLLLLGTYLLSL